MLDLAGFGLSGAPEAVAAAGALLDYVQETQKLALEHLSPVRFYHLSRYLVIDEATKRNLELLRNNLDGSKKGSLLWVLDKTCTPMGGRLLKDWLLYPLGILRPPALFRVLQVHVFNADGATIGFPQLVDNIA